MKVYTYLILLFAFSTAAFSEDSYLEVEPKSGDGILNLFERYLLKYDNEGKNKFLELNSNDLGRNNSLLLGVDYKLPVKIYTFNGNTIRSTINNFDYDYALSIQHYNDYLFSKGLKPNNFRIDKNLWVPQVEFYTSSKGISTTKKSVPKFKEFDEPLFGEANKNVKEQSHRLKGRMYYLVTGHGGPDPGAIGRRYGNILHEDEYAYDVILRLAKKLMEQGADVEIIVQDKSDGIRNDKYLNNSYNEVYKGDVPIPRDQLQRLRKRVEIINELYRKNVDKYIEQVVIPIHVDSRENRNKRIDIFFYHNENSIRGKEIAEQLLTTIEEKYEAAQPGRGYEGHVSSRGLYMLRETIPVTVYIELGNIQNPIDQLRLIESNNRQAIANWLTDGILRTVENN